MKKLNSGIESFLSFVKSADFSKAVLLATAAIIPVLVSIQQGVLSYGIAMAIGVLLSSPSDIPGSFKRRIIGILTSVIVAVTVTFLAGIAGGNIFLFVCFFGLFTFGLSMISIYGFRASLISFSGLFALVLSMADISTENSVVVHSLLVGAGGLIYFCLAVILYFFRQKKFTEELLAGALELTADYLRLRAELVLGKGDQLLINRLHELQSLISEKHETIRETLISKRLNSGKSGEARKKFLIFLQLVDIFEIGMANPVNYGRMEKVFRGYEKELKTLTDWSILMANRLEKIAFSVKTGKKYRMEPQAVSQLQKIREALVALQDNQEALIIFRGLVHFREQQNYKVELTERIFLDLEGQENLKIRNRDAQKFITHQEYRLRNLQENLHPDSPVFRHSLRLTVIILTGLMIGKFFDLQNSYWILLTSIVIMRPGFALTRERFKQRLYGTLIGGAVASGIVFLTQDLVVHALLAVVTFILAFSMVQKNYKAAAAFITLNVVFVYSLLTPGAYQVIEYRLIDTLIGAGLAFLGNSFLWPTYEYRRIKTFILACIEANLNYLGEISNFYQQKGKLPVSYKLARKRSFLALGDLSAAFQRMTQEQETKKNPGNIYEIVSLVQELLSSTASLGTFIKTHKTTAASVHFINRMNQIREGLQMAAGAIEGKKIPENYDSQETEDARRYFRSSVESLNELRLKEEKHGEPGDISEIEIKFQEARLINDQLEWLMEITLKLNELIPENRWN